MKIVVAGGTGFVGEPLVRRLLPRGDVVVLSRNPDKVRAGRGVAWNASADGDWTRELSDADVVINLAGESIAEGRWTEARKRQLVESRLRSTGALIQALGNGHAPDCTFISASAVGFYGDRGDEELPESAQAGTGFLSDLTVGWEELARTAELVSRVVILRIGVVLGKGGGAIGKMLLLFKLGAGGPMGSGRQWMSWIDREDLLAMIEWSIDNPSARGVYNATSPAPVRNQAFAAALGKALHRPAFIPTPAFALKLALGQMAEEALLAGQRVIPKRALDEGFHFQYPTLQECFARVLS